MQKHCRALTLAAIASLPLTLSVPAQASAGIGMLPAYFFAAPVHLNILCDPELAPTFGNTSLTSAQPTFNKTSAILGGAVSRLDLMTRQQGGGQGSATLSPVTATAPGIASMSGTGGSCQNLVMPKTQRFRPGLQPFAGGPDDFLASRRLAVQRTAFDAAWSRVRRDNLPSAVIGRFSRTVSGSPDRATLAAVNSWTNARIAFTEDRDQYGRADHWAKASSTLRRGKGDCEDIAIVKMQLLASLGVPRSDMYLTIARDLARNADHAFLVVKLEGQHWLLDNMTDTIQDARESHDYRAIMSFNTSGKWVHGYSML